MLAVLLAAPAASAQAPALEAPPPLSTDSAAYGELGIRVAILLQIRADFPDSESESSTFFLRKAEVGLRARVNDHTHILVELDPVNPEDPFRRTYLRLSHLPRLHFKLGMEKAPVGLEELLSSARQPFVDRSAVNDRFAMAEEVGAHLESRWDHWLFQLSVTNGGRRLLRDDNERKDVSARVVWAPVEWGSVGLSRLSGDAGPQDQERNRLNVELKLGSEASGMQGEFYRATDGAVQSSAFYVAAFRTMSAGIGQVQPAIRYEHIERSDAERQDEMRLLTFGMGIFLDGHRSKLQASYQADLRSGFAEGGLRIQYQAEF
jgi:hypothetical protein